MQVIKRQAVSTIWIRLDSHWDNWKAELDINFYPVNNTTILGNTIASYNYNISRDVRDLLNLGITQGENLSNFWEILSTNLSMPAIIIIPWVGEQLVIPDLRLTANIWLAGSWQRANMRKAWSSFSMNIYSYVSSAPWQQYINCCVS